MEYFVMKDGERVGPFQVFELKSRVDGGEFSKDDLAWMRGMEAWKPLGEIEGLDWVVMGREVEPPDLPEEVEVVVVRPWVRFWARMVDWNLLGGVMVVLAYPFGGMPLEVAPVVLISVALGWGLIEAAMLARWGTTPGKALLGVRVERDGERDGGGLPEMGAAVKRSLMMVVFGFGLGLPLLMVMAWIISFVRLRQWGRTLWDEQARLRVRHREVTQRMVVNTVAVMVAVVALSTWLRWDELVEFAERVETEMAAQAEKSGG